MYDRILSDEAIIRQPDCVFSLINQIPALHMRAKALVGCALD
jgi:hypothetical protein